MPQPITSNQLLQWPKIWNTVFFKKANSYRYIDEVTKRLLHLRRLDGFPVIREVLEEVEEDTGALTMEEIEDLAKPGPEDDDEPIGRIQIYNLVGIWMHSHTIFLQWKNPTNQKMRKKVKKGQKTGQKKVPKTAAKFPMTNVVLQLVFYSIIVEDKYLNIIFDNCQCQQNGGQWPKKHCQSHLEWWRDQFKVSTYNHSPCRYGHWQKIFWENPTSARIVICTIWTGASCFLRLNFFGSNFFELQRAKWISTSTIYQILYLHWSRECFG